MDRDRLILSVLSEGRIEADAATGDIFSRRIRGQEGKRIRLPGAHVNGYIVHRLYYQGIKKQARAHRIVWMSAHGPIPEGMMIDHINRNKTDNRLCNLRLVDAQGNAENREQLAGERNPGAKLTEREVAEIRTLYADTSMTIYELAEQYGISKSQVYNIVSQSSWVPDRVERLRGLGNAVVPVVAQYVGECVAAWDDERRHFEASGRAQ